MASSRTNFLYLFCLYIFPALFLGEICASILCLCFRFLCLYFMLPVFFSSFFVSSTILFRHFDFIFLHNLFYTVFIYILFILFILVFLLFSICVSFLTFIRSYVFLHFPYLLYHSSLSYRPLLYITFSPFHLTLLLSFL